MVRTENKAKRLSLVNQTTKAIHHHHHHHQGKWFLLDFQTISSFQETET